MIAGIRPNSTEAQALVARNNERIASLQKQLQVPFLNERESDTLRGKIAELISLNRDVQNQLGDET